MKILGIDTSGYTNAVGVVDGDRVLADFKFTTKNDSLEKIVAHIDSTLKEARLTLEAGVMDRNQSRSNGGQNTCL